MKRNVTTSNWGCRENLCKLTIITQTRFLPSFKFTVYLWDIFLNPAQITDSSSPSEHSALNNHLQGYFFHWGRGVFLLWGIQVLTHHNDCSVFFKEISTRSLFFLLEALRVMQNYLLLCYMSWHPFAVDSPDLGWILVLLLTQIIPSKQIPLLLSVKGATITYFTKSPHELNELKHLQRKEVFSL